MKGTGDPGTILFGSFRGLSGFPGQLFLDPCFTCLTLFGTGIIKARFKVEPLVAGGFGEQGNEFHSYING
jgi:hypothetical protein